MYQPLSIDLLPLLFLPLSYSPTAWWGYHLQLYSYLLVRPPYPWGAATQI